MANKIIDEVERQLKDKGIVETLKQFMGYLTPEDAKIMTFRMGLEDGKVKTFPEIEAKFGVKREQVLEIQKRGLATIKKKLGRA